jgi:cytochrome b561
MHTRYDRRTIALHWSCAALGLLIWVAGQTIDFFPKGMPRITARSVHISVGLVLAALVAARIRWRLRGGTRLPAAPGPSGAMAGAMHSLLYLLLCAVVAVGIACVWIRGDTLFNLFTVPAFAPGNTALRHDAVDLHGWLANALLAAAALHALAALWHQYVRKDGVLLRMLPGD